jgi:hypothetical protein
MPPKPAVQKKASTVSGDFVGAKFCSLSVGDPNDPVKVKVNLNCALDIVLDYARKGLISGVDAKIKEVNLRIEELAAMKFEEGEEEAVNANEVERGKLGLVVKQLQEFKQLLDCSNVSKLELYDEGGAAMNCQQVTFLFCIQ